MSEDPLEKVNRIRDSIESSTDDERKQMLDEMFHLWQLQHNTNVSTIDYMKTALGNLNLTFGNLSRGTFRQAYRLEMYKATYLHLCFMQGKMGVETSEEDSDDEDATESEEVKELKMKFNRILMSLVNAERAFSGIIDLKCSMSEEEYKGSNSIFMFTPPDYSKNTPYQNLLLFLLNKLANNGFRRYNGDCYERIFTDDERYDTHAWKKWGSIKQFIYDSISWQVNYSMWQNLTSSKDNVSPAIIFLKEYKGREFEDLIKSRNVFSFRNGIYLAQQMNQDDNTHFDEFVPYEGGRVLSSSIVACKYFDVDFEDCSAVENPFEIINMHCHNFKKIMDYQEWSEEVQRWLCILIGRMFYEIGTLEGWQIMGYLLGTAATGKSTILTKIIKEIYEPCDVGILSNNIEKKFGLGALKDKLVFIGPEIRKDLALDQSELQSMVSGEDIQVNVKHKTAESVVWKIPGMFAGNEVPEVSDNAGSIARRFLVFRFDKKVNKNDADPKLGSKLKKELPFIMQACNRLYLQMVNTYGTKDIWNIVPEYFKENRAELAENTNPLTAFLNSEYILLNKDKYVRRSEFMNALNAFCKENSMKRISWKSDMYKEPFNNFGLSVEKNKRLKYPLVNNFHNRRVHGTFIMGCCLAEDEMPVVEKEDAQIPESQDDYDAI